MKRVLILLSLVWIFSTTVAQICLGQSDEGVSKPQSVRILRNQPYPPHLTCSVVFNDTTGDGYLDAEEYGTIRLTLINTGQGKAFHVRAEVSPSSREALLFPSSVEVGDIGPSEKRIVILPLHATIEVKSELVTLDIHFKEDSGFEPSPVRVKFETRAFMPPELRIVEGLEINDANGTGKIEPGEIVQVTFRVQNVGQGIAKSVKGNVRLGENVFMAAESSPIFAIETLSPGEFKDITIAIYTNQRATEVPAFVTIDEKYGRYGILNYRLPLVVNKSIAGFNEIVVKGRDATGSKPAIAAAPGVDVDRNLPHGTARGPSAIAIIFGVEHYREIPSVTYAKRDASIFKEYCTTALGIMDDRNHIYLKTDEEVTKGEFDKVFDDFGWLAKRTNEESEVFVFFAGHGAPNVSDKTPYLIPYDGDVNYPLQTGYSLNRLYSQLQGLKAKSITVFLDACFTGLNREKTPLIADARPIMISVENPILTSPKLLSFTASSAQQISSAFPEKKHGLFTYFLLKGLRGDADENHDSKITAVELIHYLLRLVPETAGQMDREQTPQLNGVDSLRVIARY